MIRLARLFPIALALQSSLTHAATCGGLNPILASASGLTFGNYSANAQTATTANSTINVTCTVTLGNTLPGFSISVSQGGANSFSPRRMGFLTSTLNYNVYTASNYNTVWGDGTGGTATVPYNAGSNQSSTSFTAFGLIPAGQFVTAGIYLDQLTVTITY